MNEQLKEYIQSQLAAGAPWEKIRTDLLGEGWPENIINEAQAHFNAPVPEAKEAEVNSEAKTETATAAGLSTPALTPSKLPIVLAAIGLIVLLVGGGVFAYIAEIGPFKKGLPYSEESLVSGIATSLGSMETFTYSFNGKLEIEDRDPDAVPFQIEETAEMKEKEVKHVRDQVRFKALRPLLLALQNSDSQVSELSSLKESTTSYGITNVSKGITVNTLGAKDPLTGDEYVYRQTEEGFELTVKFETQAAIDAIEFAFPYSEDNTIINQDFSVTFTEESPVMYYMSSQLPKPYFEQLNDVMAFMPPELAFEANLEAVTDLSKENSDWKISMDIEGDFGDLVYKMAGDMIKNETDFYLRIRNMPSLVLGMFAFEKNVWMKVRSEWLEEEGSKYGLTGVPTYLIPSEEEETEYKKNREELQAFALEAIKIADELQVLSVKNEPAIEEKNGSELFRYDLVFAKDKIIPFYERIVAEAQKYDTTREWDFSNDTALLEYLQSNEFDAVFDYYANNTSFSLWVNDDGFIELAEYSIRTVPSDEAVQLAGKQARLTLGFGYSNINKPVKIEIPTEYKDAEEIMSDRGFNSGPVVPESPRVEGKDPSVVADASSESTDADLHVSFNGTYRMDGFGGQGFFDGESFVVQEVTLQNTTDDIQAFSASDLRLRDSDGTVFFPVNDSAVSNQPRFENPIISSSFPSNNPDTHSIKLFPNEEVKVAVTFYIHEVPADLEYSVRYKGGEPFLVTVVG